MLAEPVRGGHPGPDFHALPGIERARAYLRGLVPRPPLSHLVGYRVTEVGSGSATVSMPASPWLQHADGTVELRILIEEALGLAALTGAPAGVEMSTGTLSVRHLRPSLVDNESFVARARTVRTGRVFTAVEVVVEDAMGRAVAHAAGSAVTGQRSPAPAANDLTGTVEEPKYTTPDPYLRPLPPGRRPFNLLEEMGGLSLMQMMLSGTLPLAPRDELLGLHYVEVVDDAVCEALHTTDWLCSRSRTVSAGVLACLIHDGLSAPVWARCPLGQRVAIIDQTASFLRPVPADDRELLARGKLVHDGPDFLVSSVEVVDADGNRVALGSQTSVLVDPGRRDEPKGERVLATVVFTDIVESTKQAAEIGDERWRKLVADHDDLVRRQLQIHKGREIKTTGDGFLATFDSPGLAVQCARAIREGAHRLALEVRIGIHTGECEVVAGDLKGIAVHLAARVQATAQPGEILVSSTVCDLVSGSGIRFVDRGLHELKGVEGKRQLFAVGD